MAGEPDGALMGRKGSLDPGFGYGHGQKMDMYFLSESVTNLLFNSSVSGVIEQQKYLTTPFNVCNEEYWISF